MQHCNVKGIGVQILRKGRWRCTPLTLFFVGRAYTLPRCPACEGVVVPFSFNSSNSFIAFFLSLSLSLSSVFAKTIITTRRGVVLTLPTAPKPKPNWQFLIHSHWEQERGASGQNRSKIWARFALVFSPFPPTSYPPWSALNRASHSPPLPFREDKSHNSH